LVSKRGKCVGSLPLFACPAERGYASLRMCRCPTLSDLNRPELESLVVELSGEVADLKQMLSEQREEIARLKGLKGRPAIKPSGMDKGTEPAKPARKEKPRRRGKVTPRVTNLPT
jgi:hypothetical protein